MCGKIETVELLLDKGVNFDLKDCEDRTVLEVLDQFKADQATEIRKKILGKVRGQYVFKYWFCQGWLNFPVGCPKKQREFVHPHAHTFGGDVELKIPAHPRILVVSCCFCCCFLDTNWKIPILVSAISCSVSSIKIINIIICMSAWPPGTWWKPSGQWSVHNISPPPLPPPSQPTWTRMRASPLPQTPRPAAVE